MILACGGDQRRIDARYHPWFDASFDEVFEAVVDAAKKSSRGIEASPREAKVETAWQQVNSTPTSGGSVGRLFVRFVVSIHGTRPFEVRVEGRASMWRTGDAMPTPLEGADEPPWLAGRVDALRADIYERLRAHVVETDSKRVKAP